MENFLHPKWPNKEIHAIKYYKIVRDYCNQLKQTVLLLILPAENLKFCP
jgi:hypothetical protein